MSNTIIYETKYNSLLEKTCLIHLEGRRRLPAAVFPPPQKKHTTSVLREAVGVVESALRELNRLI